MCRFWWELLLLSEEVPSSPRKPKGLSFMCTSLVEKHCSLPLLHEIPALLRTWTKDHGYKCIASSASMRLQRFTPLSVPSLFWSRSGCPGTWNREWDCLKDTFPKTGLFLPRIHLDPLLSVAPTQLYCHNRGAVTGASYTGTASERKRFVITRKRESALSNLRALVCICMFFSLWIGMICFTWVLVTTAGLWAYCLMLCLNSVTAGLFLAFLAFSDLENIYLFFINQNCYPWKNLIRYFGACQGVANGNQGQNGSMVLDLIRQAAFLGRSYFKELNTREFSALT